MLNFLIKTWFNFWYRLKPPEMVSYWKRGDSARARVIHAKDGSLNMQIEGERFDYPGFPRGTVLTGPLAKMKHYIKNAIFNNVFAELEKMTAENKYDLLPPEKMVPAVRHIYEIFEKLENMEIVPDMKGRINLIKKVFTAIIQEDDAYRFRVQMFLDLIDQEKVRLSKADIYYASGKYWKPLRYKKFFGKVFDGYEY